MTTTRAEWVNLLVRIATPVFSALAGDRLRETMPMETTGTVEDRTQFSHLEAIGRSLAGIAPWLERTDGTGAEIDKRDALRILVRKGLNQAVRPGARDALNFTSRAAHDVPADWRHSVGNQPVVDAAFLALGFLRGWEGVWRGLEEETRAALIEGMTATRMHLPWHNNWLLFSAMVEAFLCKAEAPYDRMRIDYALRQHEQWYLGDAVYGDGASFHWDYYNSFVILPMLYEILAVEPDVGEAYRTRVSARLRRQAAIQERLIAPDGTFPPIGRSLTYRFGAFHALALAAWRGEWAAGMRPAGVRCGLTAVMRRMVGQAGMFDGAGWLRPGFCGHQPSLGEAYISTGSLYLCLCGMLPLGLGEGEAFWLDPDTGWTSKRIWEGEDVPADRAITWNARDSYPFFAEPV